MKHEHIFTRRIFHIDQMKLNQISEPIIKTQEHYPLLIGFLSMPIKDLICPFNASLR